MARFLLVLLAILVPGVVVGELATWRVSHNAPAAWPSRRCAVIVLGYPTRRNGKVHPVQRWRTEIGVRTLRKVDAGWLIFTGGATRGAEEPEAAVMARYASSVLAVPGELVTIEARAMSTWDNVRYSLPLAEPADQIAIASDPFHAERARRYVAQQRPDLAGRLVGAADYRPLERSWMKVVTVGNFLRLKATGGWPRSRSTRPY